MSQTEKKPKRIVSRAEYLGHIGKKGGIWSVGGMLIILGCAGMCMAVVGFMLIGYLQHYDLGSQAFLAAVLSIMTAMVSIILLWSGGRTIKKARKMEQVVPVTRHNTGHLPAKESLVRAASDPIQPQDELLRPAHGGQQTSPEQLLRPMTEQEQRS